MLFDPALSALLFLFGVSISSLNCLIWDILNASDPFNNHYVDHFHWSVFSVTLGLTLTFLGDPTLAFLFFGYSIPLMLFENDLDTRLGQMAKSLPIFILAAYLAANFLHKIIVHIAIETLVSATFLLVSISIPITFIISVRREIFGKTNIPLITISETTLLNRYFWIQYVASTLYLIIYLIFYIYDPAFRMGVFYGLTGIFTTFFIYALQRKLSEEEIKKIVEILKPTEENINIALNTLFMGAISTAIFVTLMIIPGIEKAAVTTIALQQAMIIEISPEVRLLIEYWMFEVLSNWFLVAFGEETLCGLFVAIGYKIKGTKGMFAAIMLGQFWTLIHIIWKPYYLYLICLSILRAILTTLYFIPIKIGKTKFQENILSCIIAHGINNMIAVLKAAKIIP